MVVSGTASLGSTRGDEGSKRRRIRRRRWMIAAMDQEQEGKEEVGIQQGSHFKALWFNLLPRLGLLMIQP